MDKPFMARQGDILFVKVESGTRLSRDFKEVQRDAQGRLVLWSGETGHLHHIAEKEARLFAGERPGLMHLYIEGPQVGITHDEHDFVPLLPGEYRVVRQREYDEAAAARERMIAD